MYTDKTRYLSFLFSVSNVNTLLNTKTEIIKTMSVNMRSD